MWSKLGWLIGLFFLVGCPKAMRVSKIPKVTPEIVLKKLEQEVAKRYQVSGTFVARSTGVKKLLGSIEVDLVAKTPQSLYISIRSFFNQPARVLATNDQLIYLLEMQDPLNPKYTVCPNNGEEIETILPLPLTAEEVVEILLGIVSIKDKKINDIEIDYQGETYVAVLEDKQGSKTEITMSMSDNVVLKRARLDKSGRQIYTVVYEDFQEEEGVNFAQRWNFEVNLKNKSYGVTLKGKSIRFNGELFDETTFQIDPP